MASLDPREALKWFFMKSRNVSRAARGHNGVECCLPGHRPDIPMVASRFVHIQGPGYLRYRRGRLLFYSPSGAEASFDPSILELVVLYGRVGISSDAVQAIAKRRAALAFLSHHGLKFYARVESDNLRGFELRQQQVLRANCSKFHREIASGLLLDKIHSQVAAARYFQRQGKEEAGPFIKKLAAFETAASNGEGDLNQVRGIEGKSTRLWFELFGNILRAPFSFHKRSKRPPADAVNSLMSLGYSLLQQRVTAQIQSVGLEASLGSLHAMRQGRASLACDLMEPLRVPLVDRWIIPLCNQRQVSIDSFERRENGGTYLKPEAFQVIVAKWYEYSAGERSGDMIAKQIDSYLLHVKNDPSSSPQPSKGKIDVTLPGNKSQKRTKGKRTIDRG